ncbi:MAG: SH3 domain-containing protein [Bacteroidia bacterium]
MVTKFGFTLMTIQEFEEWVAKRRVVRTVLTVQEHHTYSPSYKLFKGNNHFELQRGMKNHHVQNNGWMDIGQHFTTFPDGMIMTGRNLEASPACITGQNQHAICLEHLGNFDLNQDEMTDAQKDTIVRMTAALCKRFNIPVNVNGIVYHHWFDLKTGARNNGAKNNKSCPGTGFFGGNKVTDCTKNFLPLVQAQLKSPISSNIPPAPAVILKYVSVTEDTLNIRNAPSSSADKVADKEPATIGTVLRVFKENEGWYKISNTQEHWVNGKYTVEVKYAVVNSDTLSVRTGPDKSYSKLGSLKKGEKVFVFEEENGWCKISLDDKWVNKKYLTL